MVLNHELIQASAGTGKTYQLTNRYLRLLALDVPPERILALTFTRKAAGEFFDKIFAKLVAAASDAATADRLARELGVTADCARWRDLLRTLLEKLPLLPLSTYDSFFARIVQAFPLELGVTPGPTMLAEGEEQQARRQVLQQLARRPLGTDTEPFAFALSLASMGREAKSYRKLLEDTLDSYHQIYLELTGDHCWPDCDLLWPTGCPWTDVEGDLAAWSAELRPLLPWDRFTPSCTEVFQHFLAALTTWRPPATLPTEIARILDKVSAWDVHAPAVEQPFKWRTAKPCPLPAPATAILARIYRHIFSVYVERALRGMRGLHGLAAAYDRAYDQEIRRRGRLSFADNTRLLAAADSPLADEDLRPLVHYRLDARFDHWLLDEFQDTAFDQWRALAPLSDELLQDTGGERTFFAVGDLKQSIYLWRNSDPEIFARLTQRYGANPRLQLRTLAASYRSVPAVLELVNTVFDGLAALPDDPDQPALARLTRRWAALWTPHRSAGALAELPGHAAFFTVPSSRGDDSADDAAQLTLKLIRAQPPSASIALLFSTNSHADRYANLLRAENLPVSINGRVQPLLDNAFGVFVHARLRSAVHPEDHLHRCYAETWRPHLTPFPTAEDVRSTLMADGFAALLRTWADRLAAGLGERWTPFLADRAQSLIAAAGTYDAEGLRDIDTFLDRLAALELPTLDEPGTIALMTIHKAKGLDWDVVIVPEMSAKTIFELRPHQPRVWRDDATGAARSVFATSLLPGWESEPALQEARIRWAELAGFEALCALYVALTRAKRALYVIAPEVGKSSKSLGEHRLLRDLLAPAGATGPAWVHGGTTFTPAWSSGTPTWEPAAPVTPFPEADGVTPNALPDPFVAPPALALRRPSAASTRATPVPTLLAAPEELATHFGTAVHAAFQRVTWLDEIAAADFSDLPTDAVDTVQAALAEPTFATAFHRPSGTAELWRERSFEIILEDDLVTGVIDRLVVQRDATGAATHARLVDFKTDRVATEAEIAEAVAHHRPQLVLYRQAVARIFRLPLARVEAHLLFTHPRRLVIVD